MTYIPKVIVADIDVIGMKKILEINDKLETAHKILGQIRSNLEHNRFYKDSQNGKPHPRWYMRVYGDSIYLIGNTEIPIEEQAKWIIFAAANMIAFGIFGDEFKDKKKRIGVNFFLRCGIAKGDFGIAKYKINGLEDTIEIGNSMAYAYQLESSQNWIGGAILGNLILSKDDDLYLIEYPYIPLDNLKEDIKCEWDKNGWIPKYAIDWIRVLKEKANDFGVSINDINKSYINKKIDSISKNIGKKGKEEDDKITKTKKFVEYYLKRLK